MATMEQARAATRSGTTVEKYLKNKTNSSTTIQQSQSQAPQQTVYRSGSSGTQVSNDGGRTWTNQGQPPSQQQQAYNTLRGRTSPQQQIAQSFGLPTQAINPATNTSRVITSSAQIRNQPSQASQVIQQGNTLAQITNNQPITNPNAKPSQIDLPITYGTGNIPEKGTSNLYGTDNLPPAWKGSENANTAYFTASDLLLYTGVGSIVVTGARAGLGVASGIASRNILGLGFADVAQYAPSGITAQTVYRLPGGSLINQGYTKVAATLGNLGEKGAINFSGGFGSIYSNSSIQTVAKIGGDIVGNKWFLPILGFGTSIAAPTATVAFSTSTTQKPNINYTPEQLETIHQGGFKTGNIESVYDTNTSKREYLNPNDSTKLVSETTTTYSPAPKVWGWDIPVFGRLTAYSVFPNVVVDVFTGNRFEKGYKKGAKEAALGLGYNEQQATELSNYSYTVEGQARSVGETIGIIPGTITGELIGQRLVSNAVPKALASAGITKVGGVFMKGGQVATQEAGKVVWKTVITPLAVAGIAEGGTFGYLQGQAQGKRGLDLASSVAFGAATGGISAPFVGGFIAKWRITRPVTSKVAMAGAYVADWSEIIGDKGAMAADKAVYRTTTPTFTPVSTITSTYNEGQTSIKTERTVRSEKPFNPRNPFGVNTQLYVPTNTQTKNSTFTETSAPVSTIINVPVQTQTQTPVNTQTNVPTNTNIFTETNTTTETTIFTPTPTQTTTAVFTPTFTPNLPIMPFGLGDGGSPFSGEKTGSKKKKYYNELYVALGAFRGLDYGLVPSRRRRKISKRGKRK